MDKKKMYGFISAMMIVCSLFIGCSKSDDDEPEDKIPVTAAVKYSFMISQDYLNLIDATVTYWNEKGITQTEPLTTTSWEKVLTLTQSQELGFSVNATPKPNIDELLTEASYSMGYRYLYSYRSTNGAGGQNTASPSMSVSKDRVKEYINRKLQIYKLSVKWDKDTDVFTNLLSK